MKLRLTLLILLGLHVVASAARVPIVLGQAPTTVYVYNHREDDRVDNNVEGLIWQDLGLLNADGKPIAVPEAQILRDGAMEIIGYRSANGTKEAYDVNSSATTDLAWQRVAAKGTLHIAKHGASYKEGTDRHFGGGIALDGGDLYDGFGAGTAVGYSRPDTTSGPYPLTGRAEADSIHINVNSCWSSQDPDGNGPQRSVTESATGVAGIASVEGHVPIVYFICRLDLVGGSQAQRDSAETVLRQKARGAGYPPQPTDGSPRPATTNGDFVEWANNLPFSTRYDMLQQTIDDGIGGPVRPKLTYSYSETPSDGGAAREMGGELLFGGGGFHHHPVQLDPFTGGVVSFDYADAIEAAYLSVGPSALSMATVFHINMLSELPAAPPAGLFQASAIFEFENLSAGPLAQDVTVGIGFYASPSIVEMLRYDPQSGSWIQPDGVVSIDAPNRVAALSTKQMGIYGVFYRPLEPGSCFDFDPYCDGLELSLTGGAITGYWRNTDCAGTDVPVSGSIMSGPLGFGGYILCDYPADPCPQGQDWGFFIDGPLDGTMQMYSNTGTGWTLWLDPLDYITLPGPCPFASEPGRSSISSPSTTGTYSHESE